MRDMASEVGHPWMFGTDWPVAFRRRPADSAPCRAACPAGINVPRYLRLIANGRFDEAQAVIREKIPFPSVCGRVCFAPCEVNCRLNQIDGPVIIRALKRFVAERDGGLWRQGAKAAGPTGKGVAIVGSGPAGLTAAYYLARQGHAVTVFEALAEPGGMMRFAIPSYRLPKEVLNAEIQTIKDVGVEIKTNVRVGSLDKLFKDGYAALFIAIGVRDP